MSLGTVTNGHTRCDQQLTIETGIKIHQNMTNFLTSLRENATLCHIIKTSIHTVNVSAAHFFQL